MEPIARQTPVPAEHEPRAIRLTFAFAGTRIELTQAQRLAMFVPPGDSLEPQYDRSGFWLEVRGTDERVLFRLLMRHPIETTREVFPDDPYGAIIRVPVADPRGVFTVVIPEITEARTLLFVGSPPEAPSEAAREMARVDLTTIDSAEYGR